MSDQPAEFELKLKRALSPVDPPRELEARLERTLGSLVDMAAEELEAWELSTFRDPRNWSRIARPVAAAAIGSSAAVGLVLIRTQRKRHRRRNEAASAVDLVGRTVRDLAREARRVADDVFGSGNGRWRVGTSRRCPMTSAPWPTRT